MTVVADMSIPTSTIPPGTALADTDTEVKFVERIALDGDSQQYFRVLDSADLGAFEAAARADSDVADLEAIDRTADQPLYRIAWAEPPPLAPVYRTDLLVERMNGTATHWLFRLRASDLAALRALQREAHDRGTPLEVRRLDQSADGSDADPYGLTANQRDVLVMAIREGYFAIPRRTTLGDLGEKLGISDQAVSERLRRAERTLVERTVLAEPSSDFSH